MFWNAEQVNSHPSCRTGMDVASQSLCPRKSNVRPLCSRKGARRGSTIDGGGRLHLDLNALMAHELDACPSVRPTTPVTPEKRFRPNHQWMQQDTHLARLFSGTPIPLALLTQRAGTTTADARCIHHAEVPIGLSTMLLGSERVPCWAPKRSVRLERKV